MNLYGLITAMRSNEQDGGHALASQSKYKWLWVAAIIAGYNTNVSKIYKILSLFQLCHYIPAK